MLIVAVLIVKHDDTHDEWICSLAPFATSSCVVSSSPTTSSIAWMRTGFNFALCFMKSSPSVPPKPN